MADYLKLRKFRQEELILNKDEARIVLRFIFEPVDRLVIDSLNVNDAAREFAQGLLVEAIDASCSIGFVESIFRSVTNPTKGAIEILKKFGRKSAKYWFRCGSLQNLADVKVYEFVRVEIARRFRVSLNVLASTASLKRQPAVLVVFKKPSHGLSKVWG